MFRKLRGLLGVGLTWGAIWATIGALIGLIAGVVVPEDIDSGETPSRVALVLGTAGVISGLAFGLALTALERGRSLPNVSLPRVALWGAVGAVAIPLLTPVADSMIVFTCPLGALLAAGSVAIARRAELRRLDGPPSELEAPS
jgi:hypothetical protein